MARLARALGSHSGGAPPSRRRHRPGQFRDRLVAVAESGSAAGTPGGAGEGLRAVRHVEAIDRASEALDHNVNESLLMDALMVELSSMTE